MDSDNRNENTETDMLIKMMANTEKLVSSNKRWNYGDNNDESSEELDAEVEDNNDEKLQHFSSVKKEENDNNVSCHTSAKNSDYSEQDNKNSEKSQNSSNDKKMSKDELMLTKLDMLRKLGELKQCGVHLSQNYNLESDLNMMQYEYRLHHDIRSKQNSVQWMSHMMIGVMKGVEMVNDNYNPFDIKLGGLSDKISSDMQNYYAVLGDIYEKYNQPGKQMAPEMRLLLMISGAALSMQVSRAIPSMMGMSDKTEETLNELRKKAEQDSNKKTSEFMKTQHDQAAQRAKDLKMIQEKELEIQRLKRMANDRKHKDTLKLSSEEESVLSPTEIERMRQLNYQKEKTVMKNMVNQKNELEKENQTLDDMLKSLNDDNSEQSSASSISYNPNLKNIMNKKTAKVKKPAKKHDIINETDDSDDSSNEKFTNNISADSISVGSNKKKKDEIDAFSISVGSNLKGKKENIGTGKK